MKISPFDRLWLRGTATIAVLLLFVPGLTLAATQRRRSHAEQRHAAHHHRRVFRRYRRRRRYYHHYAPHYVRVHIHAARVRQIQQALIKAGVLHETPNGRWDTATRDAMRRYQEENGFASTGLPEAKPLMELGLGPHPLPAGLVPQPPAQARNQSNKGAGATSTSQSIKTSTSYQ